MRILILNGSPRVNGHTAKLVNEFVNGAIENGNDVEVINVGTKKINGCLSCNYCRNIDNGECVQQDEMQNIYPKFELADMIVFASPIYYFSFSAQLQAVINRIYSKQKLKAKQYALILTSYSPNVYTGAIAQYKDMVNYFRAKNIGIIVANDQEYNTIEKKQEAYNLGKSIK